MRGRKMPAWSVVNATSVPIVMPLDVAGSPAAR